MTDKGLEITLSEEQRRDLASIGIANELLEFATSVKETFDMIGTEAPSALHDLEEKVEQDKKRLLDKFK